MDTETPNEVIEIEIEITLSSVTKEIKKIKLPAFFMNHCHAFKVFSKESCIIICHGLPLVYSVSVDAASLAFSPKSVDHRECTEEEFYQKYIEVSDFIKGKIL